jgi:hypothetical protein
MGKGRMTVIEGLTGKALGRNIARLRRNRERRDDTYNRSLRKRVKTREELSQPIEFEVISATYHFPAGDRMTPDSPSYGVGRNAYRLHVQGKVGIPVESLIGRGFLSINAGDHIRAYIFNGEYEPLRGVGNLDDAVLGEEDSRLVLVERALKPEETPLRIEKLSTTDLSTVLAAYEFR